MTDMAVTGAASKTRNAGWASKVQCRGEFIGHNNEKNENWRFKATVKAHNYCEFFCARQHLDGGHELLVKHNNGFRAMQVGGDLNRELVVAGEGRVGTAWEFLKVYSEI